MNSTILDVTDFRISREPQYYISEYDHVEDVRCSCEEWRRVEVCRHIVFASVAASRGSCVVRSDEP